MSDPSSRDRQKPIGRGENSTKRLASYSGGGAFRYYIHDGVAAFRLQLIGELTESEIAELNGCWRTAKTTLGARRMILDLHALRSVDEAGKQWLAGMAQEGSSCSPENFLRDLVAGKHTAGMEMCAAASKTGLLGRIVGFFRSAGIEAAK